MWTFTRSVKIHILRSCSFPDWDGTFRDNSSQPFRKLSRVFGESEVLEPRVNVKLARGHKESITQAKYLNFINRNLKFVKCSTSASTVKDASGIRVHQKKKVVAAFIFARCSTELRAKVTLFFTLFALSVVFDWTSVVVFA